MHRLQILLASIPSGVLFFDRSSATWLSIVTTSMGSSSFESSVFFPSGLYACVCELDFSVEETTVASGLDIFCLFLYFALLFLNQT